MAKNKKVSPTMKFIRDEKLGALIASSQLEGKLKVSRGKFNRYCKAFGIEKVSTETLQLLLDKITEQSEMLSPTDFYKTYENVLHHKLTLKDIFGKNYSDEEFTKKMTLLETPQAINMQAIKDMQRDSNKEHRETARHQYFFEQLHNSLREDMKATLLGKSLNVNKLPVGNHNHRTLVMNFADMHLGNKFKVVYPSYTNEYNYHILKERLSTYISESLRQAKEYKVDDIVLVNIGDAVDNPSIRNNAGFDSEFDMTTQITKATKLIFNMVKEVQNNYPVTFATLFGNHDRLLQQKNDNIEGDNASKIILGYMQLAKENGLLPNVKIIDNIDNNQRFACINIQGVKYLFAHGDTMKTMPKKAQDNIYHLQGNDTDIQMLITGHLHHFRLESADSGRVQVSVPALKGADNYSQSIGAGISSAGQLNIIQEKGKCPIYLPIMFN